MLACTIACLLRTSPLSENASHTLHAHFKGLVKGEAIWFLRSNSSQDNYERTISTFRHHLLCRGYPKSFVDPLLSTVPYSLRNNYIQPPHTPNLNLSSSLNVITPYSPSLTHLYQTLTHHWDLISKDTNLTQLFPTPQLCFRQEKAVSNHLVSAKTLGRPPPPTTNVPLLISTTAKRVKPCNHPL